MSNTASTITTLAGVAVILGGQALWIKRALDSLKGDIAKSETNLAKHIDTLRADMHERWSSIDARVGRIEAHLIEPPKRAEGSR